MSIPKTDPTDNTKKDPDEWVSGDDPMTGAQASYLKTLCEQAGTSELYDDNLTKAEASKLIDEVREKAYVKKERIMEEPMMTEAQRDELKTFCQKANVPDKSGEMLTQEGAQHFIDDLKKQMVERNS